MKILIIDNYDSFTYNLVHMVEKITNQLPTVFRNDEITLEDIDNYDMIMLSPGPGIPNEAGILKEADKRSNPVRTRRAKLQTQPAPPPQAKVASQSEFEQRAARAPAC